MVVNAILFFISEVTKFTNTNTINGLTLAHTFLEMLPHLTTKAKCKSQFSGYCNVALRDKDNAGFEPPKSHYIGYYCAYISDK